MDSGEYHARYQPIVDVRSGDVVAYEALLHANSGESPGALFAAVTGSRLVELDRIAREVAIRDATSWLGSSLLFVKLAVAAGDLPSGWLEPTRDVALAAGVPLKQVVLEVVQPAAGERLDRTARVVTRCRGMGCQVALVGAVDPGVVRSLVGALLPDYVTLERSLVSDLPSSLNLAAEVTRAASAGGAGVIAFGVETEAQAAAVAALGVPWAQGWLYGRPSRPATP